MFLRIFSDVRLLASAAAEQAANSLRDAIRRQGRCRIVAATGTSQIRFLEALTSTPDIDWEKVEVFHLDEYIGIPGTHPASFRKIILEHIVQKTGIKKFHPVEGDAANLQEAIRELGEQLNASPIDLAFVGIGENGHIAFNDPPADFETNDPFLIVDLDEACRKQQVGEGWFADFSQVPERAISMSPRQILKARQIIAVVPDLRKAQAVHACLEGNVSPMAPASILRRHPNTTLYLDQSSASLLSSGLRSALKKESQFELL